MRRRANASEIAVRQRLSVLTRSLPAAEKGDPARLHEARVATRRLREAVRLVARGSRAKQLERRIRRLTRALGPVRELDVALQTLEEIGRSGDVPDAAVRLMKQAIADERRQLQVEMRTRIEGVNLEKLQRRTIAAARRQRKRAKDVKGLAQARLRVTLRAARLRTTIDDAAAIYLPDRLHDVRVAVKKLRYALEVSHQVHGSRGSANILTLKAVQDLLGRMHDLEVLIGRVRALQASAGPPNLRLSGDLDRLVRRLEGECRELHGQYIAMRKKLLALADRTADRTTSSTRMARAHSAA